MQHPSQSLTSGLRRDTGLVRRALVATAEHNSDLSDILVYTNCFKICGVRGFEADSDRSFSQPSFFQTKSPATKPCKNLRTPHLFHYVLMRVSQILVVSYT